jgi:hypothetical protein
MNFSSFQKKKKTYEYENVENWHKQVSTIVKLYMKQKKYAWLIPELLRDC